MTISTVSKLAEFAQLTVASYALFSQSALNNLDQQKAALKDAANMTEKQASDFLDKYTLIHHAPNNDTGFSATIFLDKSTGKIIFSVRGTEIPSNVVPDLIVSDIFQIGPEGYAKSQAISMYRYWKQLTTIGGQPVNYSEAEMYKLYAISVNGSGFDYTNFCLSLKEDKGIDAGQPAGTSLIAANTIVDVTGHSLGGHLAMLFSRFFPSNTAEVVTLNAPGFFIGSNILTQNGIAPFDNSKITRIEAEGDGISKLGASEFWPGTKILIAQENKSGAIAAISSNHSSVNGCDALVLMSLLAKIDTRYSSDADGVSNLIKAASSVPDNSFEKTLDYIRKFITGASVILTPISSGANDVNREYLYKNINDITTSGFFKTLAGKLKIDVSPTNLINRARTDFSAFLSLFTLSPITLSGTNATNQASLDALLKTAWEPEYQQWHDDITRSDAERTFTDTYLQDRAAMLSYVVQANQRDISPDNLTGYLQWVDATDQSNHFFSDKQNNTTISVTGGAYPSIPGINPAITFGSQSDDSINGTAGVDHIYGDAGNDVISGNVSNDYLEGNAGNDFLNGGGDDDTLIGGAGDDTLNGDAGNDYLEGGLGNDTYRIVSGEGTDTILDADGLGYIQWDGLVLSGSSGLAADKWKHPGDGVWQDLTNNINYILSPQADGKYQLIIWKGTEKIIVNGWKAGDLNISGLNAAVDSPVLPTNTPAGITIQGDFDPIDGDANTAGIQFKYDALGNVIGNEKLVGRSDELYGSYSADKISGGLGSDIINGRSGADLIFGENEISDISGYIDVSNKMASINEKGDFITGGYGNDTLIGGAKSDTFFAGDGNDIVISGAGNDYIITDQNDFTTDFDYYWKNFDSNNAPWEYASLIAKDINSDGWGEGNDIVYSGAGNDSIWLGEGNDKAYGGNNNDGMYGEEGDDYIYGEDGDDFIVGDSYWNDKNLLGRDYLDGGNGNDIIKGGGNADILCGGDGNDDLSGDTHRLDLKS